MDTGQHTPEPEDSPHQQPPLGVGSSPTSNNSTLSAQQPSQVSKDVQSPSSTTEELQASRLCSSLGSMTPEDTPALATDPQGSVDLSVRSSDLPGSGIKSLESSRCDRCGWESDDPRLLTGHVCQKGRCLRSVVTPSKGSAERDVSDSSSVSDVETFTGKIVYNPDGSAYIIEGADSECSDEECSLDLPQQEGSIVDARGMTPPQLRVFPQVVNAFHISRNPTLYGALYGQAYSLLQEKSKVPEVPIMHSYRVFSLRNRQSDSASDDSKENRNSGPNKRPGSADKTSFPILEYASVPIKPILMCFICKLSFGYAKSFIAHALSEHNLALNDDERRIMSQKNTSAIIQGVGKEKEPIISFLEPVPSSAAKMSGAQKLQGGFLTQSVPSNSSFAATDPVTSLLNVVSSSVSCGSLGGAAAVTTVVSASTSPLPSVLDIKPSLGESQKDDPSSSSFPSRTPPSAVAASEGEETLAPELADLANIEKLAKAAAAAAESGAPSPSLSSENVPKPSSRHDISADSTPSDHDIRRSPAMLSLERPTSSGSMGCISPGASVSPKVLPSSSPLAPTSHSPSTPTGTMIGLCAQHPDGKTNGVECPKCDMILGSSRSLGGHMTMMHSRNSCKTLKCPKCNWHYKYQETLEIHMKEKHPENEMNCLYCLTNQPHPRLARGETYTCGYKPYRCEVCNYSTTTKGNLSIHMQSDKHINNVQELQNGNLSAEHLLPPQNLPGNAPTINDPSKKPGPSTKPKATWRCDVCNYETNVARNLRIHMTSEKHTHNMMVLQQNVKHMQQLTALQQAQAQAQALDPLFQFHPGLLLPCSDTQLPPEAALADMAYNHALLMMASQQQQQQQRALAAAAAAAAAAGKGPLGGPLNLTSSPTVDLDHPDPTFHLEAPYDDASRIFQCCICNSFSADSVEALNQHLQQDRTRQREDEVLMAVAGSYICKLCSYKTNLKANFQLHCKTDKHLQRLQHVNHVKEGGARNEWKLKYVNVSNPVQVRCNACDYYTNSIHKLQMHTTNPRHEAGSKIFLHLQISETMVKSESKYYFCTLCNFPARTKMSLVQHIHSLQHLRNENLRQMQHKGERRDVEEELKEMFQVKEYTGNDKLFEASMDSLMEDGMETDIQRLDERPEESHHQTETPTSASPSSSSSMLKQALLDPAAKSNNAQNEGGNSTAAPTTSSGSSSSTSDQTHSCPFCNYTSNSEVRIQMHVVAQHSRRPATLLCPLCQEGFKERPRLETHLVEVHHVTQEGVQRLMVIVDQSDWMMMPPSGSKQSPVWAGNEDSCDSKHDPPEVDGKSDGESKDKGSSDELTVDDFSCPQCAKVFNTVDELFGHQNEQNHLNLKDTPRGPGYLCWKKGCNQYFKTIQAVQMHFREIHAKKPPLAVSERHVYKYRCNQCSLAFKTLEKLQLHSQYHLIRAATKCIFCGRSFRSVASLQKHVETSHTDMTEEEMEQYRASLANNPLLTTGEGGGVLDPQTTELLKKESIRDELDLTDEPLESSAPQEEILPGIGDVEASESGEQSLMEGVPKDQQCFEDYLNTQAIAEDSYNDPSRKYKCHRCKVAFTRQSYLTSHNKTLLHRKGEKLSYPMVKYLDPNRPYKCDVCKESFTQKNILLVHYNSVSHLHKLKQSMKENNNGPACTSPSSTTSVTTTTTVSCSSASPVNSTNTINSSNSIVSTTNNNIITSTSTTTSANNNNASDSDKKPFKCNICKVAYSQGSTLDIHMRSVLHQTRASKLHELAVTGQVDLNIPLIERPESSAAETPHQKCVTEMLPAPKLPVPPTSLPSSPMPPVPLPKLSDLAPLSLCTPTSNASVPASGSPQFPIQVPTDPSLYQQAALNLAPHIAQPPVLIPSQVSPQATFTCQRCNAVFMSQETLLQHQQLYCLFGPPPPTLLSGTPPAPPIQTPQASPLPPLVLQQPPSLQQQQQQQQQQQHQQQQQQQQQQAQQKPQLPSPHSQPQQQAPRAGQSPPTLIPPSPQQQDSQPPLQQPQPPPTPVPATSPFGQQIIRGKCAFARMKPPMYKHLLESYGFEIVMQFNEYYQKRPRKDLEKKDVEEPIQKLEMPGSPNAVKQQDEEEEAKSEVITEPDAIDDEKEKMDENCNLPEINRSTCNLCQKEFSSIWVLKAHKEEIHRQIVPLKCVEKFAEDFRVDYEKKNAAAQVQTPPQSLGHSEEMVPAPEPSATPTATPSEQSLSHGSLPPPTSMPHPMSVPSSVTPPVTSLATQATDVASSVTANQMAAQLQFNQILMSMGLGMGLPMGMNMPFAAAMGLHPPLIPVMMTPPMDPLMASAFNHPMMPGSMDPNFFAAQQKLLQQQQLAQAQQQQKRARTRISDEQLKILRAYFDINNSPTEEQLMEMSEKSGLPLKVIKHWFRNTLFKERQRNKDSPYNFNNPPSTYLNLEEYEKTGEAKVIPLDACSTKSDKDSDGGRFCDKDDDLVNKDTKMELDDVKFNDEPVVRKEPEIPKETSLRDGMGDFLPKSKTPDVPNLLSEIAVLKKEPVASENSSPNTSTISSSPSQTTVSQPLESSICTSVVDSLLGITPPMVTSHLTIPSPLNPVGLASALPPASESPRSTPLPTSSGTSTPTTSCGSTTGKRANRTRFTDYQIKVLQEFFETNAYPKDDDLEYLSKLLNLSPRVIVVWFQNARQKARKVYENQPPINPEEEGSGRFQRTPGLNYQCKKCMQVFQRYYELIKHQKSSCFKDENPLAIQIKPSSTPSEERPRSATLSDPGQPLPRPASQSDSTKFGQNGAYRCDKCSLVFPRFDLWREHQIVHLMNPNLFPTYPPTSPFGILQYEAQQPPAQPVKRKIPEDEDSKESQDQPRDKRLRTTILPEQLDYLYQKYQIESNPSRKMLENIAREVGLKKRVVQVWFQNTRARERKGQFRAHQQVIHKRCPFCRALFKARSALESHLATRHADQYTKGEINIDALPDGDVDSDTPSSTSEESKSGYPPTPMSTSSPIMTSSSSTPFLSSSTDAVQNTMKRYYEDSLKKYLDELSAPSHASKDGSTPTDLSMKAQKPEKSETGGGENGGGDTPLDLSKPVKVSIDGDKPSDGPLTNLSERSSEEGIPSRMGNIEADARSETHSESTDNMDGDDFGSSNPTSPAPGNHRSHSSSGKRFRTQMTTMQLKVMKSIFADYKTPSMAECEMLGREIGLPKRVVQVWFQNARAKEKKSKLAFAKTFGQEMEVPKPPEECKICNVKYNLKFSSTSMQEHLFSKKHINNLRNHIDNVKKLIEGQDSIDRADITTASGSGGFPPFLPQQQSSSQSANQQQQPQQQQQQQQHQPPPQQQQQSQDADRNRNGAVPPSATAAAAALAAAGQPSLMQQLQLMGLQQVAGLPIPVSLPGFGQNPMLGMSLASAGSASLVPASSSASSSSTSAAGKGDVEHAGSGAASSSKKDSSACSSNNNGSGDNDTRASPSAVDSAKSKEDTAKKDGASAAGSSQVNSVLNPLVDFGLPTSEATSLFPYMYPGFPGYYAAGMPGAFLHPSMYTGRNKL